MAERVSLREILPFLDEPQDRGTFWTANCPLHDAPTRLDLKEAKNGQLMLKCAQGCRYEAIVEKLIPGRAKVNGAEIAAANPFTNGHAKLSPELREIAPDILEVLLDKEREKRSLLPMPELYTAAQLKERVLREPQWAVEDFIPEGCTILVAHSKVGKTFLAEDAAVAIALGGRAWGKIEVKQGPVLYLDTEGNERRVQRRLRDLLGEEAWPEHLYLTHEAITLDATGLLILKVLLETYEPRLMALDTFNAMRPGRKAVGDLVKEDYDMIRALRALGEEYHCAILLLHHCSLSKKDDTVNAGAGTHGLAAAASAVLTFGRKRGEHEAQMDVTGNDIRDEKQHRFSRNPQTGFWTLEGPATEIMTTAKRQRVHDLVKHLGKAGPQAVAAALSERYDTIQKMMRRMADEGELLRDGGEYSIPIWAAS